MSCLIPRDVADLRIAHLFECDGPGGAERVVAHLATTLQEVGAYNLAILPADGEGWLARELAGSGVAIEYVRLNRPVSPACARSLADAFHRHDIQVAHSHEFSMAAYGSWASWLAGVHHVVTMHGSRYCAGRPQRRIAMRMAVASSARIGMITNGVSHTEPARITLRDELGLAPADTLLVAVGNPHAVKGPRYLIDALALLGWRHPRLHVAIAGGGDHATTLADHARRCGVAGRLHLLGLRSDVNAVLAAADIVVHPSLSKGLPLGPLEAMFAGRPLVASDVSEIGMSLEGGEAGLLVEPADPAALAAALDRVLSDPDLPRALGARARHRAVVEFDTRGTVRRYASIYERIASGQLRSGKPSRILSGSPGSGRPVM